MNCKKMMNPFTDKAILVVGANSDIAKSCIIKFFSYGAKLILATRNIVALKHFLIEHQIEAQVLSLELDEPSTIRNVVASIKEVDGVLFAAGYLPETNTDFRMIEYTIKRNYWGCLEFLERMLSYGKIRPDGFISVISSVGGERGKSSNRIYASAKAGLTCYLEGLLQKLAPMRIRITIIKPAYVKTKMTLGMPAYSSKIAQTPEAVSDKIIGSIIGRRSGAVYTSFFAWGIAFAIRLIPSSLYNRIRL